MDGTRDPRPGQIRIHRRVPEEATIDKDGHIQPWDDDPRGTHILITPAV